MTTPTLSASELADLSLLMTPYKRDPHPCIERCWRIGSGVTLDQLGRCPECGQTADRNNSTEIELPRATVLALLAAAQRLTRLTSQLAFIHGLGASACGSDVMTPERIEAWATERGWRFPEGGEGAES